MARKPGWLRAIWSGTCPVPIIFGTRYIEETVLVVVYPATFLIIPAVILSIRLLALSDTYIISFESITNPVIPFKFADVAKVPSTDKPGIPVPAIFTNIPVDVNL